MTKSQRQEKKNKEKQVKRKTKKIAGEETRNTMRERNKEIIQMEDRAQQRYSNRGC